MIVITVKESSFLIAVHLIVGGVKIQDQLLRRLFERSDKVVHYHFVNPERRLPIRPVLKPAERRTAGQVLISVNRRLNRYVSPQRLVIVEVFITAPDRVNTLPKQTQQIMPTTVEPPRISHRRRNHLG